MLPYRSPAPFPSYPRNRASRRGESLSVHDLEFPVGTLDSPGKDIYMRAASPIEQFRLGSCAKEPETVAWLQASIQAGDAFFDLGANVGAYTLLAATLGAERTIALEPGFSTYDSLVTNVMINRLGDRIVPLCLAASDRAGLVSFSYSSLEQGAAQHEFNSSDGRYVQQVLAIRVDELVAMLDLPAPSVLKVDVDGPELEALRGCGTLLESEVLRTVLVEGVEGTAGTDQMIELLAAAGLDLADRHFHERSGVTNFIFARDLAGSGPTSPG